MFKTWFSWHARNWFCG